MMTQPTINSEVQKTVNRPVFMFNSQGLAKLCYCSEINVRLWIPGIT